MTVTHAARSLEISPSMAHRLLQSLLTAGLVERTGDRAYSIGPAVLGLAQPFLDRLDVRTHARPIIEHIEAFTHETACTLIRSGSHRVVVDYVLSSQQLAYVPKLGEPLPLTSGATGRALLSTLPRAERDQIIADWYAHPDAASHTMSSAHVNELIDDGAQKGYFVSVSERIAGMSGVAIPLPDPVGSRHAVISVIGPATRWRPDNDPGLCRELVAMTSRIQTSATNERNELA